MRRFLPTIAAVAVLAGCSGSDSGADADADGKITSEEIAAELADGGASVMKAGLWEQKLEVADFEFPGLPDNVKEMMKGQITDGNATVEHCLTQEEIDKPKADFFGSDDQGDCSYSEFDRSGNRMAIKMVCNASQGGKATIAMNGTFDAESFKMDINNTITGSTMGDIVMRGTVTGRRLGDCS